MTPNVAAAVSRLKSTATIGSATARSARPSVSATASASARITQGRRALVALVKSARLPAGPPTATSRWLRAAKRLREPVEALPSAAVCEALAP